MDFALAELIAARNCGLQSEKAIRAGGSLDDELDDELDDVLAEVEALAAELAVVAGGVARLVLVQAALASSARPARSTDRRVERRVGCTR
jgi:hypothetical protein